MPFAPAHLSAVSIARSWVGWKPPDESSVTSATASTAVAAASPRVATRHVVMLWNQRRRRAPRWAATGPAMAAMRASSAADGSGSGPLARTSPST